MRSALFAWTGLGFAAFALLPWYLAADKGLLESLRTVFAADDSASGLRAAATPAIGPGSGSCCSASRSALGGAFAEGRARGRLVGLGALIGLAGLLGSGFAIGASGWSFAWMSAAFGALAAGQPGLGLGGALTLLALLMLLGCGLAGSGKFRGDVFVAGAVVLCAALLLLFVALPVAVALAGAFVDDAGRFSPAAVAERLGHERIWGLGCLAGGVRCGVAWNTLFLALLTAFGTTVLGTMLALVAERGTDALADAAAPAVGAADHHAAVRRRPRPDPAVRPRRHRQPGARVGLRRHADALVLRPARRLAGAAVRLHADRLPDHARRRRTASARRSRRRRRRCAPTAATTFRTVTLPLLKPGLANAFLVGFIESIADFGNPIVVGGQYAVLSTEIFFAIVGAQFDQGRAASLALVLTAFALAVFFAAAAACSAAPATPPCRARATPACRCALPAGLSRRVATAIALPWLAFTLVVYLFAFAGGFVQTWGRDYTPTLRHFVTAFDLQWATQRRRRLVWAGTAWNSLFTTAQAGGDRGADLRRRSAC